MHETVSFQTKSKKYYEIGGLVKGPGRDCRNNRQTMTNNLFASLPRNSDFHCPQQVWTAPAGPFSSMSMPIWLEGYRPLKSSSRYELWRLYALELSSKCIPPIFCKTLAWPRRRLTRLVAEESSRLRSIILSLWTVPRCGRDHRRRCTESRLRHDFVVMFQTRNVNYTTVRERKTSGESTATTLNKWISKNPYIITVHFDIPAPRHEYEARRG